MPHPRVVLLACAAALALTAAPAVAGSYSFDLATDFAPSGMPTNPFSSGFGYTNAWSFKEGNAASRLTPTSPNPNLYSTPSTTTTTPYPARTIATIYGSEVESPNVHLPFLSINRTSGPQTYLGTTFAVNQPVVSPSMNRNAIVAFKAAVGGTYDITGSLSDVTPDCGTTTTWYVDRGATPLASGSYAEGGSTTLTGVSGLTGFGVATNDTIYLTIASESQARCDATAVNLTLKLRDNAAPAPTISASSPPARTSDTKPTFQGTGGTDFGDQSSVTLDLLQGSTVVQTYTVALTGSSWSRKLDTDLAEGTYTARVTQSDRATTANSGSAERTVTIDTTAPAVTMPTGPASVTANRTPTFSGAAGTATGDAGTVTVKIFPGAAATGDPVRTLSATVTAGSYSASVPAGSPLADGTYTARAEQADDAGNTGLASNLITFRVDGTAPLPVITSPGAGSLPATPDIKGTAETATGDDGTVTVKIYSGSAATGTPAQTLSGVTVTGGEFTATPAALSDGTWTVVASQSDSAANTGTSAPVTFSIDSRGPAIALAAVPTPSENQTPSFSGTTNEAGHALVVRIYQGTSPSGTVVQTVPSTLGSGTFTTGPAGTLADGTYTAQAEQSDGTNLGVSPPVTFQVDVLPPVVSIATPATGPGNDSTPTVSGTAGSLANDSSSVRIDVYPGSSVGSTPLQTHNVTRAANGAYGVTLAELADGDYIVAVTQTDSFNTGPHTTQTTRTFTIDTAAPVVTQTAPADGLVTQDGTPTVAGTVSESGGSVRVRVYSGTVATGSLVQTRTTTASGTAYSTQLTALTDGVYTIRSEQDDAVGNTGLSAPATIRVDSTAPAPAVTAPTAGTSTADNTPDITGTAGNATGDASTVSVLIQQGGSTVQTLSPTRSGTAFTTTASTLPDGSYTAVATQADDAGNSGSSTPVAFVVDTVAPAPTLTSPAQGSTTADSTPDIGGVAGTGTGDGGNVTLRIYSGTAATGTPVDTLVAPVGGGGAYAIAPTTALPEGQYAVQGTQTDAAGNSGQTAVRQFSVDTTAPDVTFTAPAAATSDTTPTLSGTAGHAGGDSVVTVKVYEGATATGTVARTLSATPNGSGAWTVDVSPALADGTWTAVASQQDAQGNLATSIARTLRVDTAAPAVAVSSPASGATIAGATPAFAGTAGHATGDDGTVTVRVFAGSATSGTALQTLTAAVGSDGGWAALGGAALGDGGYTAVVTQSDAASNAATPATRAFVVKTATETAKTDTPKTQTPKDTTAPTAVASMPIQSARTVSKSGTLLVDFVTSEPANVLVIAAISKTTARRLGLKTKALDGAPGLVAIGQVTGTPVAGPSQLKVTLTAKARKALRKVRGITVTLLGLAVDGAGNRTTMKSAARLTK